MNEQQVFKQLFVSIASGSVPGGAEAQGAGATDPHRVHPAVGGG